MRPATFLDKVLLKTTQPPQWVLLTDPVGVTRQHFSMSLTLTVCSMTNITDDANPVLIEIMRGDRVECGHRGAISISDASGNLKLALGDIGKPIYPRSSIKAIQSLPLVESGAADAYGFGAKELALACASHSGETWHVDVVRMMLDKIGLDAGALVCGTHWPMGTSASRKLAVKGEEPSALHNNCSGKHAGMVAAAIHLGFAAHHYDNPDHPLQQQIRQILEGLSEDKLDASRLGIDGCSVPNWAMSLHKLSNTFAKLFAGSGISDSRAAAFQRLINACRDEPELMSGSRRFCGKVLRALPDHVFLKGGAEGVYCGVFRVSGLGIALKIDDGARRASEATMANVISAFLPEAEANLSALTTVPLKSWQGVQVGMVRPSDILREKLQSVTASVN